ncbi:aromatic-ring-hydroxylating dioxygenase subunit beta [Hydrogenophaga intermedia]|jgi:3-phenylpropionate/cinnamic acid dioxygenase small subunit|uniref:aromatic-ring-hydroxylating dioxygenase subunit beta n=1 Tax=Hydrogenophaga intermedia TaxID=65786 RepID=UPI0020444A1C|nr:nuclear transport factor 2 family protein [Hydrogenophaga intermedia]MCM3566150.1 nuclear transport factor 2 family protein [Hydrogenophaga intermedia]
MDLNSVMAFNAAYADAIDSDRLEEWPDFFTSDARYRVTNIENEQEGLPAGVIWANSRNMLIDRVAALREANVYERQRYRHLLGVPMIGSLNENGLSARTPFMVARIMATGETLLFATGVYRDQFVLDEGRLLLAERVAVCDSTVTDTLMALPL